jgi:Ca2+-binding RTX toxin-like protein
LLWGDGDLSDPTAHGADYLDGGAGDDELTGGGGDDGLIGGGGNEWLYGGDGNDYMKNSSVSFCRSSDLRVAEYWGAACLG